MFFSEEFEARWGRHIPEIMWVFDELSDKKKHCSRLLRKMHPKTSLVALPGVMLPIWSPSELRCSSHYQHFGIAVIAVSNFKVIFTRFVDFRNHFVSVYFLPRTRQLKCKLQISLGHLQPIFLVLCLIWKGYKTPVVSSDLLSTVSQLCQKKSNENVSILWIFERKMWRTFHFPYLNIISFLQLKKHW